jgi:lipopolysaccharide/colanic/teichoic acid biosynthesis glycosyltransferase
VGRSKRCAVVESFPEALSRRQHATKRALDVGGALLCLALLWPFLLVGWVAARVSTRDSGIFRQERVGRFGEPFDVMKLRTMRAVPGVDTTVTSATDVRITRTGAWLRRLKIDELPQLVNVLRGEMSLVGPRPDVAGFADALIGDDRVVLAVRPGITGPAALAFRHEEELLAAAADPEAYNREVIWSEKVRINKDYVRTWSLLGDVRYLLATAGALRARHDEEQP